MFAGEIRRRRIEGRRSSRWRWHLDVMVVKVMASGTIFGELSITKAKFWKALSPIHERRRLR
jgi:hypothetical protein